jgi:hypothetical protein
MVLGRRLSSGGDREKSPKNKNKKLVNFEHNKMKIVETDLKILQLEYFPL